LHQRCGERVVVVIDEYDKPLLDTIGSPAIHLKIREELKRFYGVLKSHDGFVRFVFITGVTKFSHVSVFSDLNHLDDLTLDPCFADICGLTQEEVEANFEPEIATVLRHTGKSREKYLEELHKFYNGYRFSKNPITVYNPFGMLLHFKKGGDFSPYWYDTGSPSFLIHLIKDQKINIGRMNRMRITERGLRKFDVANMDANAVLYQAGYLTISEYDAELGEYVLDFPNQEVCTAFTTSLAEECLCVPPDDVTALIRTLPKALAGGDIEGATSAIRAFFAAIPYEIIKPTENYYETAILLLFKMLGLRSCAEVHTATGRMDMLVETNNYVYCFEFKLDKSADEALAQINTKEYTLAWEGKGRKVVKVGVALDCEKRNIGAWKVETVE
jgi:hypothetical protein